MIRGGGWGKCGDFNKQATKPERDRERRAGGVEMCFVLSTFDLIHFGICSVDLTPQVFQRKSWLLGVVEVENLSSF